MKYALLTHADDYHNVNLLFSFSLKHAKTVFTSKNIAEITKATKAVVNPEMNSDFLSRCR